MKRRSGTTLVTTQLAALGDPVRLRVLRLLEREELAVGEVAKVVQLPQSTVSRHLKVLADGGWIIKRTEGTATFYRLLMDDLATSSRALWVAVRDLSKSEQGAGERAEAEDDLRRLQSVLSERSEDAMAYFGRVAGQWDDVRTELFGQRFTSMALLHLLKRDWVVADLGCGTGNASELLAPLVKKVIAVDQSAPMLDACKKRLKHLSNVEFVKGELGGGPAGASGGGPGALPLQTSSVDAAVCILVLHHVESPARAVEEMARIVRPGGRVLIVDMVEHERAAFRHQMGHKWQGFSHEIVDRLMRNAGIMPGGYLPLPPETQARGPGLFAAVGTKPEGS